MSVAEAIKSIISLGAVAPDYTSAIRTGNWHWPPARAMRVRSICFSSPAHITLVPGNAPTLTNDVAVAGGDGAEKVEFNPIGAVLTTMGILSLVAAGRP